MVSNGKPIKYCLVNADDVLKTTGEVRRTHTSARKAEALGFPNAKPRVENICQTLQLIVPSILKKNILGTQGVLKKVATQ